MISSKSVPGRRVCPVCGGLYTVRKDGELRNHRPPGQPTGVPWCPGEKAVTDVTKGKSR